MVGGGGEGGRKHEAGLQASPRAQGAVQANTQHSHSLPITSRIPDDPEEFAKPWRGGVKEATGEKKDPYTNSYLTEQKSWP